MKKIYNVISVVYCIVRIEIKNICKANMLRIKRMFGISKTDQESPNFLMEELLLDPAARERSRRSSKKEFLRALKA